MVHQFYCRICAKIILLLTRDRIFFNPTSWLVFKTIKSGAQTQIRLAVDPDLEKVSGKYFQDCKQANPSSAARDDETAVWLWKASEELTHLAAV